jgi:glycolate oxidase FAD binding subunit
MGTLGLIGEVILRLHPRPAASATVRAVATAAQASAATWQLSRCGVEPSAIEWTGVTADDPAGALLVRVDGSPAGVAAGSERILSLLATAALAAERLDPATAAACWAQVADAASGGPDDSVLRAGTLPDRLPLAAAALARRADEHEIAASLASSTGLGLHTAVLRGPAAAQLKAAAAWRHDIVALGGAMSLRNRPPAVTAGLSALGDPPSSAALLRAVKQGLDPHGCCGPGRFAGWY